MFAGHLYHVQDVQPALVRFEQLAAEPYDLFIKEQIAGDELGDYRDQKVTQELIDRLAATGFLRTASDPTDAPERGFIPERMNIIADEIQVITSAVMGITVGCAVEPARYCPDDPVTRAQMATFLARALKLI